MSFEKQTNKQAKTLPFGNRYFSIIGRKRRDRKLQRENHIQRKGIRRKGGNNIEKEREEEKHKL